MAPFRQAALVLAYLASGIVPTAVLVVLRASL
jgi:hypothetical protein